MNRRLMALAGDVPRLMSETNTSETRSAWFTLGDVEKWRSLQWLPDIPPEPVRPQERDVTHRELDRSLDLVLVAAAVGAAAGWLVASLLNLLCLGACGLEWRRAREAEGHLGLTRRVLVVAWAVLVVVVTISAATQGSSSPARGWLVALCVVTFAVAMGLAWRHRDLRRRHNAEVDALVSGYNYELRRYESLTRNREAAIQRSADIVAARAEMQVECLLPQEMRLLRLEALAKLWREVSTSLEISSEELGEIETTAGRCLVSVAPNARPPQRYPRPVLRLQKSDGADLPNPVSEQFEILSHLYDVGFTLVLARGLVLVRARYDSVENESAIIAHEQVSWRSIASVARKVSEAGESDEVVLETLAGTRHRVTSDAGGDRRYLVSVPIVTTEYENLPDGPLSRPDLVGFAREAQARVSAANGV